MQTLAPPGHLRTAEEQPNVAVEPAPDPERRRRQSRTMSVEEAADELGIGRTTAYMAARNGTLPGVIRIGRRVVVSREAIERLLAGQ